MKTNHFLKSMPVFLKATTLLLLLSPLLFSKADDIAPTFEASLLDGTKVQGRLSDWNGEGVTLLTSEAEKKVIPLHDLIKLVQKEASVKEMMPAGDIILFPYGDRVAKSVVEGEEKILANAGYFFSEEQIGKNGSRDWKLPATSILGIAFLGTKKTDDEQREDWILKLQKEQRQQEVAFLTNGDVVRGGYLKLVPPLHLSVEGKTHEIREESLVALGFDSTLAPRGYVPFKKDYIEVTLKDNSRLGFEEPKIVNDILVGQTRAKVAAAVEIKDIARLYARHSAVSYLSETKEAAVQYRPYLRKWKNMAKDQTLEGRFLKIGGEYYDHGLSVRPATLIGYRLPENAKRFQATVAQDDRIPGGNAADMADADISVYVDKNKVFEFNHLKANTNAVDIDVDVSKGQILILRTEFGKRGDTGDQVDWIDARLIGE